MEATTVLSTLRIDISDFSKIQTVLDAYILKHPGTQYLVASEISDVVFKQHFQGWVSHTSTKTDDVKKIQHSFNKHMHSQFPELQPSQRSFALVDKPLVYYSYILRNDSKECPKYEDIFTNYSEEQVEEFKQHEPFVKLPAVHTGRNNVTKARQDKVFDTLVEKCVKDGKIIYSKIPTVYLSLAPSLRTNRNIAFDHATGYTLRMENLFDHDDNKRVTYHLWEQMHYRDGKPTFFNDNYNHT